MTRVGAHGLARVRWLGLAAASLVPAIAAAQAVDEIVAKHLAARGGAARIAAIESLRTTAKVKAEGGREAVVVREIKRPGRIRAEFTAQGVTGVYACDGERGWLVSPFDGRLEPWPMPPDMLRSAIEWSDIGGPLVDWKEKGHRVELVGRESLEGGEVWKLKATLKNGDVRYLYLNARSFQHVRTEATRTLAGRPVETLTTFGDYGETAGILFPRAIEIGVEGRPGRLRIQVQTVEVNPVLDDARFRMPDVSRAVAADAPNVTGLWTMAVETAMGGGNPRFALTQKGEEITGNYEGRFGEAPVKGTIKGDRVTLTLTASVEGQEMRIEYDGTVDGDSMAGKVTFGGFGEGTFKGTRAGRPQP